MAAKSRTVQQAKVVALMEKQEISTKFCLVKWLGKGLHPAKEMALVKEVQAWIWTARCCNYRVSVVAVAFQYRAGVQRRWRCSTPRHEGIYMGDWRYCSTNSKSLHYMDITDHFALRPFQPSGNHRGTHFKKERVGPTAGLGVLEKRQNACPCR